MTLETSERFNQDNESESNMTTELHTRIWWCAFYLQYDCNDVAEGELEFMICPPLIINSSQVGVVEVGGREGGVWWLEGGEEGCDGWREITVWQVRYIAGEGGRDGEEGRQKGAVRTRIMDGQGTYERATGNSRTVIAGEQVYSCTIWASARRCSWSVSGIEKMS